MWGMRITPLILNVNSLLVNLAPRTLYPPHTHWLGCYGGSTASLEILKKGNISCLSCDSNPRSFSLYPSHYSDYTTFNFRWQKEVGGCLVSCDRFKPGDSPEKNCARSWACRINLLKILAQGNIYVLVGIEPKFSGRAACTLATLKTAQSGTLL